jgi:hypothetical protein
MVGSWEDVVKVDSVVLLKINKILLYILLQFSDVIIHYLWYWFGHLTFLPSRNFHCFRYCLWLYIPVFGQAGIMREFFFRYSDGLLSGTSAKPNVL